MKNELFNKILKYVTNKEFRYFVNTDVFHMYRNMSDYEYLKKKYKDILGRDLNLDNPKSFTEKLQWLKINDRRDIYSKMVDKYEAKKFISSIVGDDYVIPTLGVWNNVEDIDFDKLPNQFVLKCTHDSASIIICKDKNKLNLKKVKRKLNKSLKRNFYVYHREWPYKNVPHRIICEPFMKEDDESIENACLTDYKFFCFNGEPQVFYISKDKGADPTTDFFDMNFKNLPFRMKDPNSKILPKKPECFEQMREMAKKLSKGIPHLRVDFYYINKHIYVGELTFYHCAGFVKIVPEEWDYKLGNMIDLSSVKSK